MNRRTPAPPARPPTLTRRWPAPALVLTLLLAGAGWAAQTSAAQPSAAQPAAPGPQAIIRDAQHVTAPNGIEELKAVQIGGIKQWISVRGNDRRNPVLLFIHGGPGSTEMPVSWLYQRPWEDSFTVVQWDQRGAGKTAAANPGSAVQKSISVDRMTQDGTELVAYLRQHYGKRKIFVMGHSWGTVIGLNIAKTHPDWLHAYIGMGQFIDGAENEALGYSFAVREAQATKNAQAIQELKALAPYPGPLSTLTLPRIVTQRKWVIYFGGLTAGRNNFDYDGNARTLSPAYSAAELAGSAENEGATLVGLLPQLVGLDYRKVTRLECPTFIFAGRRDFETPSQIAATWFARLHAPSKKIVWFEHSAHMMQFEQPGRLLARLVQDVRPIAVRAGDAAPEDRPGVGPLR
ncbi:alpha/beta fold hydrolase [Deinococcus sp.]|uniref:alpha/beta fold hydrolase n=1 Tax=Deinococcus sp. TaxID=47478 RepID=UPI003C7C1CF4